MNNKNTKLFEPAIVKRALLDSIKKLNPAVLMKNPVMFIVEIGAFITTVILIGQIFSGHFSTFNFQIALWLWFTVLFANFAEAVAEGRGKAQAESLKKARKQTNARKLVHEKEIIIPADNLKR